MIRSSDGVEIAYATHGAGADEAPAVVLVHGWAGNRTYWDQQVDYLAERNVVIAVDLGGHGASGLGRDEWNLPAFGDDVLAVVDDVGVQRFALSPEQVEAFVAPFRADFEAAVARFVRNLLPAAAKCELVDRITTDMTATPREVALGSLPYARNRQPPILAALADITAPLVAINPGIGPTDVDSLRQHGVEPIVLADVGRSRTLAQPS